MSQKRKDSKTKHNISQKQSPDPKDDLSESRIITKNLVYVIGLSSSLANKEKLQKYEYFGQYGTIIKIVVNKNKAYNQNSPHGPSFSAYVTYSKPTEASIAILSLDEIILDNHSIRASFGTTKYCSFFLKGVECNNKDCLFLHTFADENEIIKRGDLNLNKAIFASQHIIAIKIADIYNPEVKNRIMGMKRVKTVFPPPYTLYQSKYVIENTPNFNFNYNNKNNKSNIDKNIILNGKKNENEWKNKDKNDKNKFVINNESTSNSSKEDNENNNNLTKNLLNKPFSSRETSRFSFCKNNIDNNNNSVNIPIQIRYLLDTKINLYNLSKYMNQNVIDDVLENEYINSDSDEQTKDWGNFIKENSESIFKTKQKDELENEVENINKFIMKKVWLYNKDSKSKTQKKKD
jgi:hypothetical protein